MKETLPARKWKETKLFSRKMFGSKGKARIWIVTDLGTQS